MDEHEYSALSGRKAAEHDLATGEPGLHRTVSNAAAYTLAYDAVIRSAPKRPSRAARIRSLIEDSGCSRAEAVATVDAELDSVAS